jgi:hypothetical protein
MGGADLDLGRIDSWKRVIQGHDVTVTERHLSLNDIAYFVSWISIIKSFHDREFKTKQALILRRIFKKDNNKKDKHTAILLLK